MSQKSRSSIAIEVLSFVDGGIGVYTGEEAVRLRSLMNVMCLTIVLLSGAHTAFSLSVSESCSTPLETKATQAHNPLRMERCWKTMFEFIVCLRRAAV